MDVSMHRNYSGAGQRIHPKESGENSMMPRMVASACFSARNFSLAVLLAISAGIAYTSAGLPPEIAFSAAAGLYGVSVVQMLASKSFQENFNKAEKMRVIRQQNAECLRLANQAKRLTNSVYYQKLKTVMDEKETVLKSYMASTEKDYVKEKIVEQTMNLTLVYIKLLINFCQRSRDAANKDQSQIINRINMNTRKLEFQKGAAGADDIKKAIEMDQRMLENMKNEKVELERIGYKLDYIESSMGMLKHQTLSSVDYAPDIMEQLDSVVNEVQALDSVLEDRKKSRSRLMN